MKKIIMTSLMVLGFATVASAAEIVGGTSTTIGNATFNASKLVTLQVIATTTDFAVAGKHLNSGTTYGLTAADPIMRKTDANAKGVDLAETTTITSETQDLSSWEM